MDNISDRIRVLKAVGFIYGHNRWWPPGVEDDFKNINSALPKQPDLTQDDLAAKYLLPITTRYTDCIWPNQNGWSVLYNGTTIVVGTDDIITAKTFGQALHAFTIAILDAGVIE